jgi:IMP dehydrogenase
MAALTKSAFFKQMSQQGLALTYNDVRLEPGRSSVPAASVDITSRFSKNIELKAPFVSAAMDTVTESSMAIAMAKLGGIGVIHGSLSPKRQKEEVRRVKLHLNGLIENPVSFTKDRSVSGVLEECDERGLSFRTFPVVDKSGKLVGLVTRNDFELSDKPAAALSEIMTPLSDVLSAKPGTTVKQAYSLMTKNKKKTLPILDTKGKVDGLYIFSDVSRIARGDSALYNVDSEGRLRVAAAVPTRPDEAVARVSEMRRHLDVVVVDSARGDSIYSFDTLKALKKAFPDLDVVVGNVSVAASAKALAEAGADGIKVGQGPGSICTTRIETGIGVPQVTAVYDCAQAVEQYGIPVCADGGITNRGDVSIALAVGAGSVMMGSMLSGTKETPGEVFEDDDGSRVKLYRGMGSEGAMSSSAASRIRYSGSATTKPLAEGVESVVPYKGTVGDVIGKMVLALRASLEYVGVKDLPDHRKNSKLNRNTPAGINEAKPHDVKVVTLRGKF